MQQRHDDPYEDRNTELQNLTLKLEFRFYSTNRTFTPIPVAARSKAWVCGSSLSWDCGFEYRAGNWCLSPGCVMCCRVEVSATDWSLVQRSPNRCGVSENDHESSTTRRPWSTWLLGQGKTKNRTFTQESRTSKIVKYGKNYATRSTTWHIKCVSCCVMATKQSRFRVKKHTLRVLAIKKNAMN